MTFFYYNSKIQLHTVTLDCTPYDTCMADSESVSYNGYCFKKTKRTGGWLIPTGINYEDHKTECEGEGGFLAIANSQDVLNALASHAGKFGDVI